MYANKSGIICAAPAIYDPSTYIDPLVEVLGERGADLLVEHGAEKEQCDGRVELVFHHVDLLAEQECQQASAEHVGTWQEAQTIPLDHNDSSLQRYNICHCDIHKASYIEPYYDNIFFQRVHKIDSQFYFIPIIRSNAFSNEAILVF